MSGQHITLNGQIGKGAFAEVFRATDEVGVAGQDDG